jgi:hypothetical protein
MLSPASAFNFDLQTEHAQLENAKIPSSSVLSSLRLQCSGSIETSNDPFGIKCNSVHVDLRDLDSRQTTQRFPIPSF